MEAATQSTSLVPVDTGIQLNVSQTGTGEPLLLITGSQQTSTRRISVATSTDMSASLGASATTRTRFTRSAVRSSMSRGGIWVTAYAPPRTQNGLISSPGL